jgi:hypothetical protein
MRQSSLAVAIEPGMLSTVSSRHAVMVSTSVSVSDEAGAVIVWWVVDGIGASYSVGGETEPTYFPKQPTRSHQPDRLAGLARTGNLRPAARVVSTDRRSARPRTKRAGLTPPSPSAELAAADDG